MAILKNSILGRVTGKLGNVVIRELNGKLVASIRPAKYKTGRSQFAKTNRNRFAVSVNFARCVNSINILKEVWRMADLEGTYAFNRILKYNIPHSKISYPSENNVITPKGFSIEINNLVFENDCIEFILVESDISNYETTAVDESCLIILMAFYEPKEKTSNLFAIDHVVFSLPSTNSENEKVIKISTGKRLQLLIESYSKCNFYFAEVVKIISSKKFLWSSTVCKPVSF